MKKTYLDLIKMRFVQKTPLMYESRRFGGPTRHRNTMAYKESSDFDEDAFLLKVEQRAAKMLEERGWTKEIAASLAGNLKNELTGAEQLSLRALADEKTGALAKIVEMGTKLQELRSQMEKAPTDMSIRTQCQKFLDDNKEKIEKRDFAGMPAFEVNLNFRDAANPMLPANVMPNGTAYISKYQVQPGINELLRPEPTFWDFVKKGSTNAETYIWVNKRPTEGSAAWIGPGEYKPPISFTVETENSHAKKVAVSAKMATELFDDIDGFTTWVTDELYYQLMMEVDRVLTDNNAATSKRPRGLKNMSIAYNPLTGVKTTNANFWDAIKAMTTMLRVTRFKGRIVAFVNPVDLANGVMTKAQNQGQLFIPPVTGATIVEDLNMPLGYVQVVAMDYYKLLIYKAFSMTWGLENDDLTKNLRTVIGEMRLHEFHSSNYDGFAIYDSIDTVKAAINQEQP